MLKNQLKQSLSIPSGYPEAFRRASRALVENGTRYALVRDAIENDADEAVEEGWMLKAQSGCTVELNSADIPEIENRRLEVGLLGMKE